MKTRKTLGLVALLLTLIIGSIYYNGSKMKQNNLLKVGFPAYWGSLIPSLQHTGYADALMINQFEALVRAGSGGVTDPSAAKSWKISDDYRIFTFKIDTNKRFSNGQSLTAMDFKRSWEYGLKLDPKSSNSSLQDVMYRVAGFENFKETGDLSGVRIVDDETLEIEFKESFRMALTHLSGSRVSAFVKDEDNYIGTGPYIIKERDKKLYLSKNRYSNEDVGYSNIEVTVVPPPEAGSALESGAINFYALAEFANIGECFLETSKIGCQSGSAARHQSLMLNGLKGRFFNNKLFRLAIQTLVIKKITSKVLPPYHKFNLNIDAQIYLPLQTGRLKKDDALRIINDGEKYINEFIRSSQKYPLYMVTSEESNWIQKLLEDEGVKFTPNSGFIKTQERIKMYYKGFEPDIILMAFSVSSGDPDGIYHSLGENGSIGSPIQYRPSVGALLESGRKILDILEADKHYQRVSIETLREVPFVHIGFTKTIVAYRKDQVRVQLKYRRRNDNRFSIYEPI